MRGQLLGFGNTEWSRWARGIARHGPPKVGQESSTLIASSATTLTLDLSARMTDRDPTPRPFLAGMYRSAVAGILGIWLCGCASNAPAASPEVDTLPVDRGRAEALLKGASLPDRFEIVALADRLAVAAVKASSREAMAELAALAASLRVRLFRVVHAETDGREAAALLDRVAEVSTAAKACDAGVERAKLMGELSHDPAVTLREAHAAWVRWPDPVCQGKVDALATSLGPYVARAGIPARRVGPAAPAGSSPPPSSPSAGAAQANPDEIVASPEPLAPSSVPVTLQAIEPYSDKESARVVVRLSGSTSFKVGVAPPNARRAGPRVYIDIARSKAGKVKREMSVGGLVERVRVGPHEGGARVVLDLSKNASRRVFYLPDPFRIVIDVSSRPLGAAPVSAKGKREVHRIALDPGHGGSDPGATGPGGLQEKDVTLDIAHRAASVLARELNVSALVTRDRDEYVALEERTARANAFGADLFVSIHCNASESSAARGVQTYVLDTTSDEIAARVAARENNASSAQAGADVARLLSGLRMAEMGARSAHLAELLQRAAMASLADKYPGTVDQGVKTAGFYVLVGALMPAVLFETSFVSNPTEEERLKTPDYRQRLADSIVNAVKAYRDGL